MSLSSTERDGGAGASQGLVPVPRLVLGRYAEWRPQMETALMRTGIAERDYREENADWAELTAAVEKWTRSDERASIDYALGRGSATGSSSSKAGPTAAEKEARRGAAEAVARTKKAYALLYQALPDELRRLVAQVPQGYAYGVWSWLEKRFQSTEQDHVGDLWDEFTKLAMEEDESFDVYKARVDRVFGLLAHAKDKPSPGQYTHRLLWKLTPRYNPAVLALKASGKLKDAASIDWEETVAFLNNHERSERRLQNADEGDHVAAAATRGVRHGRLADVECFNCGEKGHMARHCRKSRRGRQPEGEHEEVEHDDEQKATLQEQDSGAQRAGKTSARRRGGTDGSVRHNHERTSMAFTHLSSGSDEEDEQRGSTGKGKIRGGLQF
jgi:hypothetical protein